jgi:hypothetical protein
MTPTVSDTSWLITTGWTPAAVFAFEAWGTSWALGAGQRLQVLLLAVCATRQCPASAQATGRRMTFAQRPTA